MSVSPPPSSRKMSLIGLLDPPGADAGGRQLRSADEEARACRRWRAPCLQSVVEGERDTVTGAHAHAVLEVGDEKSGAARELLDDRVHQGLVRPGCEVAKAPFADPGSSAVDEGRE